MSTFGLKYDGNQITPEWANELERMLGYGSGTTPFVRNSLGQSWVCDGTADDIQVKAAIEGIDGTSTNTGGTVTLSGGQFNFTGIPDITYDLTNPKRIIIQGLENTVIASSQAKVFDVSNVAWIASKVMSLSIRNIKFEHNSTNATDITLDLSYSHAMVHDVWLSQQNATVQGTAFKIGPISSAGKTCTSIDITASGYGTGFDHSLDHGTLLNCVANTCSDKGFYLHDCVAAQLICPQVYNCDAATVTTVQPFVVDHQGWGSRIESPNLELGTRTLTGTMFTWGGGAEWVPTPINNISLDKSVVTGTGGLSSHYAKTKFLFTGEHTSCKCSNNGIATGTGAQQTIPHGLATTPTNVLLSEATTGGALAYRSAASDTTNIYVLATLNKTFRWDASI